MELWYLNNTITRISGSGLPPKFSLAIQKMKIIDNNMQRLQSLLLKWTGKYKRCTLLSTILTVMGALMHSGFGVTVK